MNGVNVKILPDLVEVGTMGEQEKTTVSYLNYSILENSLA